MMQTISSDVAPLQGGASVQQYHKITEFLTVIKLTYTGIK